MNPLELGLMELRAALDARELSNVELMSATLARIDAINPSRNAIVARVDPEVALAAARALDSNTDQQSATDAAAGAAGSAKASEATKAAADAILKLRLLRGIPQASKDTTASKDIVTTWGSPLHANYLPQDDHIVVARMRAAGAIFVGKTNVPEFGYGSHSFNTVYGVTRNAFDPNLSAGGSSGGASVAVATGMLAVADGSDVMGSLRNPAAFNRVVGMRPSSGLVPNSPSPEGYLHSLASCGPIARSVADLAGLLSVQAGHDPRDPHSLPGDGTPFAALARELSHGPVVASRDRLGRVGTGLRRTAGGPPRIGWLADLNGHLPMEDGILEQCEAALKVFTSEGAAVEPARLAMDPEAIWESWLTARSFLIAGAQADLHADADKRARMKPEAVWEIERGLQLTALAAHRASVVRTSFLQRWIDLFETFDFVALPTAQVRPFPVDWRWPEQVGGRSMDTYHRWMEVVLYPTLAGSPAISLPVPGAEAIGLQLIGPPGTDLAVLQAAAAYQDSVVGPRGWRDGLAIPG